VGGVHSGALASRLAAGVLVLHVGRAQPHDRRRFARVFVVVHAVDDEIAPLRA
jgi:hypothetical protein